MSEELQGRPTTTPEPGDPDYDAFLREVQRLADERQAAQEAGRGSRATRRAVQLFGLFLLGAIGLAIIVSVWLGFFWEASFGPWLIALGIACLALGAAGFWRVMGTEPD